jgi:ParB family transcriptional regulator, chromosome partitioning protein
MEVTEIAIADIKVRFRLRDPDEEKVSEIMESISQIGLLNPITLDTHHHLIAGFHRLLAYKSLKKKTIPAIIKDVDNKYGELCEIDENLKRAELSLGNQSRHIARREELMRELGLTYQQGDNRHTIKEGKISVEEMAKGVGMSKRSYQHRKQLMRINEELMDLLINAGKDDSLTDLVRLSAETEEMQWKIGNLLITGKCRTWKMAFFNAKLVDFRLRSKPKVDFDVKERWGEFPKSIMKFQKVNDDLRKIVSLVNHDDELRLTKGSLRFGETPIRFHSMNPEQALFALDYYTETGDLIADMFQGRGTTAITSLYLKRRFIGWDINPYTFEKTKEVIRNHTDASEDDWDMFQGDGCDMKELEGEENVLDGVFTSPPYYGKAEAYTDDSRDLCNMDVDAFNQRIDVLFGNLTRLIKKSSYKERVIKPIIMVIGAQRFGDKGIIDMDYYFQEIAKSHGLVLWDKQYLEIHCPQVWTSFGRNAQMKFVQKNYESQLVWVKF